MPSRAARRERGLWCLPVMGYHPLAPQQVPSKFMIVSPRSLKGLAVRHALTAVALSCGDTEVLGSFWLQVVCQAGYVVTARR